jgi:peptidoglycan/LPS O-acetylase OafA/YrhL
LLALLTNDPDRTSRHRTTYQRFFATLFLAALAGPPLLSRLMDGVPTVGPFPPRSNVGDPLFTTRVCLIDFGIAGLILTSPGHWLFRPLRDRRLVYLGVVSYGLYLYHPLVYATLPGLYRQFIIQGLGLRSRRLMDATTLATCFAIAELSRRWLEAPTQRWKDRLAYRTVAPKPSARVRIDLAEGKAAPRQARSTRGLIRVIEHSAAP